MLYRQVIVSRTTWQCQIFDLVPQLQALTSFSSLFVGIYCLEWLTSINYLDPKSKLKPQHVWYAWVPHRTGFPKIWLSAWSDSCSPSILDIKLKLSSFFRFVAAAIRGLLFFIPGRSMASLGLIDRELCRAQRDKARFLMVSLSCKHLPHFPHLPRYLPRFSVRTWGSTSDWGTESKFRLCHVMHDIIPYRSTPNLPWLHHNWRKKWGRTQNYLNFLYGVMAYVPLIFTVWVETWQVWARSIGNRLAYHAA